MLTTLLELGRDENVLHGNAGGLKVPELKRIAKHLGIPTSQGKGDLLKCIFAKSDKMKRLNDGMDKESVDTYGSAFRKDKNTFIRLANFLFQSLDRLATSKLISTRNELQNRQYNEKNPI